jgi:hypothetical protein
MTKHERPQIGGSEAAAGETSVQSYSIPPARPDQASKPPAECQPEAEGLPIALARSLSELAAILPGLRQALERRAEDRPRVEPLAYRLDELAGALGVSRRALERERAAGRLPKPDFYIGKIPLYQPKTIRAWLDSGGKGVAR